METLNIIFPRYSINNTTTIGRLMFSQIVINEKIFACAKMNFSDMQEKESLIKEAKKIWAMLSFLDYKKNKENMPVKPFFTVNLENSLVIYSDKQMLIDTYDGFNIEKYCETSPIAIWFCLYLSEKKRYDNLNYLYNSFFALYKYKGLDIRKTENSLVDSLVDYIDKKSVVVEEEYEEAVDILVPVIEPDTILQLENLFIRLMDECF